MSRFSSLVVAATLAAAPLVFAGPCDIYENANTPCVAAHSTTRALFNAYNGNLYQVVRASDNTTKEIAPLSAGGTANAATQDTFCASSTCHISMIYDQSGNGNHLSRAPPGQHWKGPLAGGYDTLANATAAPVTLNGHKAYGVYTVPGTGYRNDQTKNIPLGSAAQGIYAVVDGTHYNDKCCFDYGNAEVSNSDTGAGKMEALYFGSGGSKGQQSGSGPWIKADLENGLYPSLNSNSPSPSVNHRFVHGVLKGQGTTFALAGGDATSGSLTQYYDGPLPSGYTSMKKGAVILGIGGDNSHWAEGTFYEGVLTSGFPTLDTDQAVQANIVAAKYAA